MKKAFFLLTIILFASSSIWGQKVKIKSSDVFIDEHKCLKFEKDDNVSFSLFDEDGKEICFVRYIHDSPYASQYIKIIFPTLDKKLTSANYVFTRKNLIKKFIKHDVIKNCKFIAENVDQFIMRYNENVEDQDVKTIIIQNQNN